MKTVLRVAMSLLVVAGFLSCNGNTEGKKKVAETEKASCESTCDTPCNAAQKASCGSTTDAKEVKGDVQAYYFHYTRRCATCKAVESVTAETLKEYYGEKISLKSINLDEETSKELAKKLEIDGQTLLIVKGDKKINLTNEAFMNARSNPDKFKEKLKGTVESVL